MTRTTVQAGFDTWADSGKPSAPHGDDKSLHVKTATERVFVHTAIPAPPGSTVVSALFTIYAKGASTGSRTITLYPIIEPWKARGLNWNNQPAVSTAGSVSVTVGALADKDPITFDVSALVQAIVSGDAPNFGWRISTSSSSDHKFYSAQSGVKNPKLVVEYVEGPAAPTNLLPAGGLVGVAKPTLRWTYAGGQDMASYRVQADPDADEINPAYDSGTVSSTDSVHALVGTTFNDLATSGLSTTWRVRVTDTAGQLSEWSDWVTMTRDDKGTLTLNNPAAPPDNYVTEPTPPILFTLTGETLAAFRVLITDQVDHNKVLHDSGKITGTTGAYTLPLRDNNTRKGAPLIVSGGTYSVCVRAFDTKQRQGSLATGDERYVEVWRDFTMVDTSSVTSPVLTSVTQNGVTPAATVTFTRGTAPDEFIVLRDGVEIATGLLPGDLFVSGTTYAFTDWAAHPGTAHAYTVKAVVNGVQSQPSTAVVLTGGTHVGGLWLIDPDTGRYVTLWGTDNGDWAQTEVGTSYQPLGSRSGFRITESLSGMSGTFLGQMGSQETKTVAQMEADLWTMKDDAPHSDDFRLVVGHLNIPVQIYNLACTPNDYSTPTSPVRNVSFAFYQTGEFEFDGNV